MDNLNKHFAKEVTVHNDRQQKIIKSLNAARNYLWINVCIYIAITIVEYFLAGLGHSEALRADALNNLSGVISTGLLIVGSFVATDNDDDDDDFLGMPTKTRRAAADPFELQLSRFKLEPIFNLVTSVVIIVFALQIILSGLTDLRGGHTATAPNVYAMIGAAVATVLMLVVYAINRYFGGRLQNASLLAASRDSLGDVATSAGTLLSLIVAIAFKLPWLDGAISIVIGCFVLWSGGKIFQDSALNLTDYANPDLENQMKTVIEQNVEHVRVVQLKVRNSGNARLVDVGLMVDGRMTALSIYRISEHIEHLLSERFQVYNTQVSTVPDPASVTTQ